MKYLRERREALGGHVPQRQTCTEKLDIPSLDDKLFDAKPLLRQ